MVSASDTTGEVRCDCLDLTGLQSGEHEGGVFVLDDLCTVFLGVGFTAGCLLCTNADTLQVCGGGDGGTLGNQIARLSSK